MKIAFTLFMLIITVTSESCDNKLQKQNNANVKVWCLRKEKDEIILKVENKENVPIYLPEDFWPQYIIGQDTLHLETVNKKRFSERSYYYYNQFGKTLTTGERIEGLLPTLIKKVESDVKYNQFRAPKLIELLPNKSITKTLKLILPLGINKIKVRIYQSRYNAKVVSYQDFIEFEDKNSFVSSSKIYEIVNQ